MKKVVALLKLVRWPNLVFIALTQFLIYQFILKGWNSSAIVALSYIDVLLLVLSTILIAGSGYMINDYFDIRIDAVNKPERLVLTKLVSRRAMIRWHILLNILAIFLVVNIAWENRLRLLLIQLFCIAALVFYSVSFKRKLFVGNVIVGLLIGISVLLIGIYEPNFQTLSMETARHKLIWLYTIFAFLITLIREIVKDAEDMKGDLSEGCRTIPIVYGLDKTKQFVFLIYFFLLGLVVAFVTRLFPTNPIISTYFILGVIIPSIVLLRYIYLAKSTADFAKLSSWIKWLTLSGILSMVLV